MPLNKARYEYFKVYRPRGARYANSSTQLTVELAVAEAMVNFEAEFGFLPRDRHTLIEVLGVTRGYAATVWEIKDAE